MPGTGLMWLDERFADRLNFCLTFVRGSGEEAVFSAFGADPGQAVPRTRQETERMQDSVEHGYGPFVRVGRAGDWLFAWEEGSAEGARPEVLRRLSAGGAEAVAVRNALAAFAGFGYAADGEVITSLVTIVPFTREGSDPDRFLPLVQETGLTAPAEPGAGPERSWLWSVLTVAERAFGLSVDEAELERALPCARILPVLPLLPARRPPAGGGPWPVGDPAIDGLMAQADAGTLRSAAAGQVRGVLADSGLDEYPELVQAVDEALAGRVQGVADEEPARLVLRRVARQQYEAEQDGYSRRRHLPPGERSRRAVRYQASQALYRVLAWGPDPALGAIIQFRRRHADPGWREQFRRALAGSPGPS